MADNTPLFDNEANAAAALLAHLPVEAVLARYRHAKGNEIGSHKFASPQSSAALVANTFGFFLDRPGDLPPLPGWRGEWRVQSVLPEAEVRFPWRGGLHPWLDALIETEDHLVGVEAKRYEPFRTHAASEGPAFSEAYRRPVWGERMKRFEAARDLLARSPSEFRLLNAVQLVKHAFALRTRAQALEKTPVLVYLYAEPKSFPAPTERPISDGERQRHAQEVHAFARLVEGAEVSFLALTYRRLFESFASSSVAAVHAHGCALREQFDC